MNLYEHTIIARQDTSPSELKQLTEKYSKIVEKNDGEVVKTENWGLLNLSYLMSTYNWIFGIDHIEQIENEDLNFSQVYARRDTDNPDYWGTFNTSKPNSRNPSGPFYDMSESRISESQGTTTRNDAISNLQIGTKSTDETMRSALNERDQISDENKTNFIDSSDYNTLTSREEFNYRGYDYFNYCNKYKGAFPRDMKGGAWSSPLWLNQFPDILRERGGNTRERGEGIDNCTYDVGAIYSPLPSYPINIDAYYSNYLQNNSGIASNLINDGNFLSESPRSTDSDGLFRNVAEFPNIEDPYTFSSPLYTDPVQINDNAGNFELQRNIRMKIPTVPDQRILELEESFGGTSLDWLGTKTDRHNSGAGIKVAILDTGIDANHESLLGLNFSEVSLIGEGSKSGMGHGTGIASIIAGQTEGFLGLAPSSEILSVQVLGQDGVGDSFTIARGIMLAVDEGADIINLSLGGGSSSVAIDNAIQYAKSRDVLLVSAVGNEGIDEVAYPARHKDVIAVSSVDANSRVSTFANFGPEVDLAAPGVGVFTAWENSSFVEFSGTSISAAFVSGALAHELSQTPLQNKKGAIQALYANVDEAEKPGKDIWAGRGVINMRRLDQRNTPGIVDAAVVGYYFDPNDLSSTGTTPFQVTVQNQGTTWIQSMNLKVKYKGLEKDFRLGNLSSGETRSETLYFDSGTRSKEMSISSELKVFGMADSYPENNVRNSRLVLP